jgi:hypothetical protein
MLPTPTPPLQNLATPRTLADTLMVTNNIPLPTTSNMMSASGGGGGGGVSYSDQLLMSKFGRNQISQRISQYNPYLSAQQQHHQQLQQQQQQQQPQQSFQPTHLSSSQEYQHQQPTFQQYPPVSPSIGQPSMSNTQRETVLQQQQNLQDIKNYLAERKMNNGQSNTSQISPSMTYYNHLREPLQSMDLRPQQTMFPLSGSTTIAAGNNIKSNVRSSADISRVDHNELWKLYV